MVNYERLASKAVCPQYVLMYLNLLGKLRNKSITQIVTTILQGLLFRGLWSYLLVLVLCCCFFFFFFFDKQSPCEFCRSFNHLVPDSWSHHILQSFLQNKTKAKKEQEEPERSFTQKAGLLWCLEEPPPAAGTKGANTLHEACRLQELLPRGNSLKFHLLSKLWHRIPPVLERRHVPRSCGPPCGFQISLVWEKSDWTTLPAQALFETDEKSVSNSQFLPWAPLLGDYSVILWLRN